DDAGGPERDPHHLDRPDERSDEEAKQVDVGRKHDENANPVQAAEEMALDPIVRRSLAVLLEHPRLADGAAVVERALEHDVAQTFQQRAMRIALAVGERVVLAMAGD